MKKPELCPVTKPAPTSQTPTSSSRNHESQNQALLDAEARLRSHFGDITATYKSVAARRAA